MTITLIADNVRIGIATRDYYGTVRVTVRILNADTPNRELSIIGEVGPPASPNAVGQVRDALTDIGRYARGWNREKVKRLYVIWDVWHLRNVPENIVTELQEMF